VHGIAVQLHILSLQTLSENFVIMLNTDRQTIDKCDATKNTHTIQCPQTKYGMGDEISTYFIVKTKPLS